MPVSSILRRRARHIIAPLLGALLVAYFAYHAVQGDRGLLAYLQLTNEIRKAEITRDLIHAERVQLEKHVTLLRPDRLDADMLDERARLMLNVGHADDVVVMLQRPEPPPKTVVSQ